MGTRSVATAAGASRWGIMAGRPPGAVAWGCFSLFLRVLLFLLMHFISLRSWVSPQIAAHMTNNGKQQDVVQMDAMLPTHRRPLGVGGDMSVREAQHSHPRLGGVWKKWAHCCHLPQQVVRAWEGTLSPGSFRGPISPHPFPHSVPGTGDRPVKQQGAWREWLESPEGGPNPPWKTKPPRFSCCSLTTWGLCLASLSHGSWARSPKTPPAVLSLSRNGHRI